MFLRKVIYIFINQENKIDLITQVFNFVSSTPHEVRFIIPLLMLGQRFKGRSLNSMIKFIKPLNQEGF
jgi:hypothetical protein